MVIRPCRPGDLAALERAEPTGRNQFHRLKLERQDRGECTYLTAWDGDLPLGHGELRWAGCSAEVVRSAYPKCPEINGLLVYKLRGQGIGTALITTAEDLARSRGYAMIGLGAGAGDDDDPRPRALYERLGYTPVLEYVDVWKHQDDAGETVVIKDPCTYLVKALSV